MNDTEFQILLNRFEREYDPFGTYKTNPLTEDRKIISTNVGVQPAWTSGDEVDGVYVAGTHERITTQACYILMNDMGFWGANQDGSIIYCLSIVLASINPDRDPFLGPLQAFSGHFYDPDKDTKKLNTARSNAKKYYNKAVEDYIENSDEFIIDVGNAIHYAQDACEPHHTANYLAVVTAHSQFEESADLIASEALKSLDSIERSFYMNSLSTSVENIVHDFAKMSKVYAPAVKNTYATP